MSLLGGNKKLTAGYFSTPRFSQTETDKRRLSAISLRLKYRLLYGRCRCKYAGNNPLKYTDPDGRTPKSLISNWMASPDAQGGKSISTDAPQRAGGYTPLYEFFTKNSKFANIDSLLFKFTNSEGRIIHLWLWKGDYNLVDKATFENNKGKMEWHKGGEIGTYVETFFSGDNWAASIDGAVLSMSFDLYHKGSDSPFISRKNNGEYWLNGFFPGSRDGPENIIMKGKI